MGAHTLVSLIEGGGSRRGCSHWPIFNRRGANRGGSHIDQFSIKRGC